KKIPVWAMITLSILPLWAFLYVLALRPEPAKATGPIGAGVKLYAGCSGCHGANGEGGAGRAMQNGALLKTFPHIEDQLNLVYTGSQAFATAGLPFYGDASVGHLGYNGVYVPQQGKKSGGGLTDAEILAVVCHERYDLSGADKAGAYAAEYTLWCAPGSPIYAALTAGTADFDTLADKFKAEGVLPIGTAPRPATPAG
ncbi:MAG: c-type cytochrome, partial [Actinomycetota bacterium]